MAKTTTEGRVGLNVRKLADYDAGTGSVLYSDHLTGEPAKYPLKGVVFTDPQGRSTNLDGSPVAAPKLTRISTDYAQREPWIELVNPTAVVRNGGSAQNPTAKLHTFVQADEIVLHMIDGDYRYRVTHQPDKYEGAEHANDADHVASNAAGDPNTHVDWYYDVELIEE